MIINMIYNQSLPQLLEIINWRINFYYRPRRIFEALRMIYICLTEFRIPSHFP